MRCPSDYNDNERLEFLGDSILDAVISEVLYKRFPSADEGFLTQMRTKIVNGESLSELANKTGVSNLIMLNPVQNLSRKIAEDAFEAFIGAIYLDKGYEAVMRFVEVEVFSKHINLQKLPEVENNYKSRVYEWTQKHKIPDLKYDTQADTKNKKWFVSKVLIKGVIIGKGKGRNKITAEQKASERAYKEILHNETKYLNGI